MRRRARPLLAALAIGASALAPNASARAQARPPARPAPAPAAPTAPAAPAAPATVADRMLRPAGDSLQALPFADFARQVLEAHPVARQARLSRDAAREELRAARGAFDPTLTATVDQKAFLGTTYYNYAEAELKIPTPLGSDIKLGYERALGQYIAADRRTGNPLLAGANPGIVKLGFSVPVGQRIITDERRNALAQARALQTVAEADQAAALNKLLFDAAKSYAAWYEADRRRQVAGEGVQLAEFRQRAVRARYTSGEAAAIDTVEAALEVQRRQVQRLEAEQAYNGAALEVAGYLWQPGARPSDAQPLELAPGTVPTALGLEPERVDSARVPRWLELAAQRHPDVLKVAGRVDQAEAQRVFVMQQAIPFAELSLNSVAAQNNFGALTNGGANGGFNRDNYVIGGQVRTPLLFMKERARFRIADQRLDQQELELARTRRNVTLDVRQTVFDLSTTFAVLELQRSAVAQARQLLRGEQRRFENGESQLLFVNIRERFLLDEALKLASLEAKYAANRAALAVAVGDPAVVGVLGAAGTPSR